MRLRASRTLHLEPLLPASLQPLRAIANNLYWTWNTDARSLFERIDRRGWEASGHNPLKLLQSTPREKLGRLANDEGFLLHVDRVASALSAYLSRPPRMTVPGTSERSVIAYFSLEFALTEGLPNYSGGLGVLAGDHLKSASDLGLPLVGVGLLYHEGYFQQALGPDGWQQEAYQDIDFDAQPLRKFKTAAGEEICITVPFDGRDVSASVWRLDVGQTPLLLLDTDMDSNTPADRALSSRLYGGDSEMRIQQEMLLGIGGVRALHALDLHPAVCHMNEGHSALLGVERIRVLMEEARASFDEARLPVTAATVFTTHTAVAAGIDLFSPDLVRKHLGRYYESMGLDGHTFIGLGRVNPDDESEPFSMALLGLRLSGYRNGVSRLHGGVSRRLWAAVWPNLPEDQVPIDAITNGVHLPTWISHDMGDVYDRYVGLQWRDDPTDAGQWQAVHDIPDEELWAVHERQREALVARARAQATETALSRGISLTPRALSKPLDPQALTVGFARRFAGYKRSTLLFRDPERLARILNHSDRPVQIIFAGKAHPRDEPAKQLIREVLQFSQRPEFRERLLLLERYDVDLARSLVQGCDVWLNTPLRPLEASGTSGMKAVANGALHCSVMDGWWWEAYRPGLGWEVGRNVLDDDPEVQDAYDAESLYELLETEITGSFYDRDRNGLPRDWIASMKRSIAAYAPVFNTSRMVMDYAQRAYAPATHSWHRLRESHMAPARDQAEWLARVTREWGAVKICAIDDDTGGRGAGAKPVQVRVQAHFGALSPDDVRLDVLFGPASPNGELTGSAVAPLSFKEQQEDGVCLYTGGFEPSHAGRIGYTIRVLPSHPDLHNPFAAGLVHWA